MPDAVDDLLAAAARALDASPDYRVLERLRPRSAYAEPDGETMLTAWYLDVETTGLDPTTDVVIQLAAVPFQYAEPTGRIYTVGEPLTYFEDPGRPIPPFVVKLTGITDADVAGQRIDDAAVELALADVDLVVAHNAAFDRPFCERRLPAFRAKRWACSQTEIKWIEEAGVQSAGLELLLARHCRKFYDAHRADEDCYAGIELLATPLPSGDLPMGRLLATSAIPTVRVWAIGSPFELKDTLKARGYRWSPGEGGRPKAWYIDVAGADGDAELDWLARHIYPDALRRARCDEMDATVRFSGRV